MNAVIYARFSCSKQREESIDDQIRVCTAAAKQNGDRIVKTYCDEAISGKTTDRPQFRRMIADAEKSLWTRVYVYKLDRFARNRYDAAMNRSKLRKAGVEIISATEHISDGPDGILMEALLEGMAEYYSAQLSENVRRGIEGKALECKTNGRILYGYRKGADGRYAIDENEAPVIRRMFETVASGGTIKSAIEAANSMGKRGRSRIWTKQTAGSALRREQYTGVYLFNGHRVEGGMPAIVDRGTFDIVQSRLAMRHHAPRDHDAVYLLSGKLKDDDGNYFVGSSADGHLGTRYYYYRCLETSQAFRRDDIDELVSSVTADALSQPGVFDTIADMILDAQDEAIIEEAVRLEALKRELADLEREYDRTIDAAIQLGVTDRVKSRIADMDVRREELQSAIDDEQRSAPYITRPMIEFWLGEMSRTPDIRTIIASFVRSVTLHRDDTMTIDFIVDCLPQKTEQTPSSSQGFVWVKDGGQKLTAYKISFSGIDGGFSICATLKML